MNRTQFATLVSYMGCTVPFSVNGSWSEWNDWTTCNEGFGYASQFRFRECIKPPPSNGGTECTGRQFQLQSCSIPSAPNWSSQSTTVVIAISVASGVVILVLLTLLVFFRRQ